MECISSTQYSIALNGGVYGCIRGLRQGDPISPLLFVICMEYFARIMQWVAKQQGFEFHTKFKSMRLNDLCFVDDMLIFGKEERNSVVLMLRGLKTFSMTSGLTTNATKSNIFSAKMDNKDLDELCEVTRYAKGILLFKYLGVPISWGEYIAMAEAYGSEPEYPGVVDKNCKTSKRKDEQSISMDSVCRPRVLDMDGKK
ncbi:uncharacterized protein LOC132601849 [Lycium barbarum]|uniref:uncharacterized protein LOC132601849 n=1 Tax=Lycium barbarum TaxID=112863 RepID=UPI00293F1F56|nr:uncharacterized protein LOC132601849 [Lycium barbarum]